MAKNLAQLKHKSHKNEHGQNGHAVSSEVRLEQAVKLLEARRFKESDAICLAVLEKEPHNLDAYNLIAVAAKDNGDFERAVKYFHQALTLDPTYVRGLFNLANLMREHGYVDESNQLYESILIHDPNHVRALSSLSIINLNAGNYVAALIFLRKLITLMPNDSKIWAGLAQAMENGLQGDDAELEEIVTKGLHNPHIEIEYVVRCAIKLVSTNSQINHFIGLVSNIGEDKKGQNWQAFKQEIIGDNLLSTLQKPLIRELMNNLPIPQIGLENLLTNVRAALLELSLENALEEAQMKSWQPTLLDLACQCFLNEYIYNLSDWEKDKLVGFANLVANADIEDADKLNENDLWNLNLLACYQPVYLLKNAENWAALKDNEFSRATKIFLTEQIINPRIELALKPQIEKIGNIKNEISQSVKAQYEENPYPRWKSMSPLVAMPVAKILNFLFPEQPISKWRVSSEPEILIAGCGTGKHALVSASRFANAKVLAIDLSTSSLAYAIRKAQEHNNKNIIFRQADILELGELELGELKLGVGAQKFDIIESVGVLHHMQDPMMGWKTLTKLLKPKGFMRIGLYSELARKAVIGGRELVQNNQYNADIEGIRSLRKNIISNQYSANAAILLKAYDFYNASECRDLLFHVQEHRFTLPQIKESLAELGLEFLGFENSNTELFKHYAAMFPADKTMNNLDNWQVFEETYPFTFAGMYQFWVQKI